MTIALAQPTHTASSGGSQRFRLHRAGILNVWQYDEQEFTFADGRLLLRGANGAGKSKTLEMLLPFALDGDKARITASAKHHTSLLWLMTDGYEGQTRVGYVWVEFLRSTTDGTEEAFTCGIGIRASATARTATAWHFATSRRIGHDLVLEDDAGPLSRPRLEEILGADGQVFEKAAAYKEHVGRALFGLDSTQYDEVLRLLYWLRQPQIGEDIEPAKLAQQLSQALPQLDEQAVRSAGDTFDELTAFGDQIERRAAAAEALGQLAGAYANYARAVVAERALEVVEALQVERRRRTEVQRTQKGMEAVGVQQAAAERERDAARTGIQDDDARLRTLEAGPEFRNQVRLGELASGSARDAKFSEQAQHRLIRQTEEARRRSDTLRSRAHDAQTGLRDLGARLRELDRRQFETVPGSGVPVPAVLDGVILERVEQSDVLTAALDQCLESVQLARSAVSRRTAGIGVVRGALADADIALAAQRQAEYEAATVEARWEDAREARVKAELSAGVEAEALTTALAAWIIAPPAPEMVQPDELTEESVLGLALLAKASAASRLATLHEDQGKAAARRDNAEAEIKRLTEERAKVKAERDPAPPAPVLARTKRNDGHALWQVIDFESGLDADARAGLEAALQASGLLDAWVRPGGLLLDPEHLDVVLSATASNSPVGDILGGILVPDLPIVCDLTADDVGRVLAAIGTGSDPDALVWVRPDGSWRLGPTQGRAAKQQAQFIGATARAQERTRRLAVLDAGLAEQFAARDAAERDYSGLSTAIAELDHWVESVPSGQALLSAWTRLGERREAEEREERENRSAQAFAHAARTAAANARDALERLAAEQALPADRGGLEAVEQELRGLDEQLQGSVRQNRSIRGGVALWIEALGEVDIATAALAEEQAAETEARRNASASRAALEALRASVGDSVQELERKIREVRKSQQAHKATEENATKQVEALIKAFGVAEADSRNAKARLAEHLDERTAIFANLVAIGSVPGLFEAAGATQEDAAVVSGLKGHPPGEPVARQVAAAAEVLAGLSQEDVSTAFTRVWRNYNEAASGPAADHQPVVSEYGPLLAVTGRDEAGDAAVVVLAQRVGASVERDRGLLTDREKQQFEQHILGELGDAIRKCRRDADELVVAMNDQLGHVATSQGIRVKLDWKLRDDVPAEARAAVELLAQPVGALIPEERAKLRDVLHRLIEASRAERPELSYGEHLAAALDYRTWSEFTIRYTRPERPGHWERLHRRSALSQGEQKVLCYLPLFAAAASHFTSLAGAAPHAPRLVLLDDAFPKIDVRTHPLLFGLLVQLDLDFVITSERLWGDHQTVPSLAIYEALRDPSQRGIAQYEYRWDGRALQALG
ncbi:TIGR02680 family protein [Arthrobacter sp. ISL-28]|uniref:TIGR02680 family protein n=1 Tax=Arthrobacter sp. ISL-28 TaxID=2819108 RepID=UPI001BE75E58|nr:TIGR02680 family protein [Arthrobacter sp. ISL-28]MBT2521823.1 TIGR02680 family protein [Arthrobacter sp. ISL-28]